MPVDVSQFGIRFQPVLLTSSSISRFRRCVAVTPDSGRSGEFLLFVFHSSMVMRSVLSKPAEIFGTASLAAGNLKWAIYKKE